MQKHHILENTIESEIDLLPKCLDSIHPECLIVEDILLSRKLTQATLYKLHIKSVTASDGESALSLYHEHQSSLQLILLDLVLSSDKSKLDGFGVAQQIRAFENKHGYHPVTIAALTGQIFSTHFMDKVKCTAKCKQSGINEIFQKGDLLSEKLKSLVYKNDEHSDC